ncbi:MAG: S8 family serine peptidase, partial [Gemmataceae bacterium]
ASCMPGNQYAVASGTSQAAPHVAGLVAVMLSSSSPVQPFPPTPGTPGTPGTPSQLVQANIPTIRNLLITTFIPGKPATPPTPGGSSADPATIKQRLIDSAVEQIPGSHGENRTYPLVNVRRLQ